RPPWRTPIRVCSANADSAVTVVMSGLDYPCGLAFGPDGALYVAEAGRGGDGPCANGFCVGASGAVNRLWRGEQKRTQPGIRSKRKWHLFARRVVQDWFISDGLREEIAARKPPSGVLKS